MRFFKALLGVTVAVALIAISSTSSFAAAAVTHPDQTAVGKAAEIRGTIIVAQRRGRVRRGRGGTRRGNRVRRGNGVRRGNRGRRRGRRIGGAIAGALIGAAILSEAARAEERRREFDDDDFDDRRRPRRRRASSSAEERCADRFRSFRFSDGTYQPYDSDFRRLCPYLR